MVLTFFLYIYSAARRAREREVAAPAALARVDARTRGAPARRTVNSARPSASA